MREYNKYMRTAPKRRERNAYFKMLVDMCDLSAEDLTWCFGLKLRYAKALIYEARSKGRLDRVRVIKPVWIEWLELLVQRMLSNTCRSTDPERTRERARLLRLYQEVETREWRDGLPGRRIPPSVGTLPIERALADAARSESDPY